MIPPEGRPILTAAEMRMAEEAQGDCAGLMNRAGNAIAAAVRRLAGPNEVLIACGPGNNGGDGYVAASILRAAGISVRVVASADPTTHLARRARAGWTGEVEPLATARPAPVLIDALFGTGLSRPLAAGDAAALHRLATAANLVIAVDLPSGVATDDGRVFSPPPQATVTLALGAMKPSHLLQPAARFMGTVRLVDIGLTPTSRCHVLARPDLPEPNPDSQKFTRGMVAVIGGAMAGAGEAASVAAMRSGAGYVIHLGDGQGSPHALVRKPWSATALDDKRIGAVVVGPGLGRDETARAKLDAAIASARPLVIDGDALHLLDLDRLAARPTPAILTPHAGEFKALFGDGGTGKIDRTRAAAARADAVVMFKGADTVIAVPDGRAIIAGDASDWLSTAGTGDVLAGTTGAMLASGLAPLDAAAAAVWLNRAAARRCGRSFIADDLATALSRVR
jgi:hydroxyethylthiazole kinase-like uncharacterized protein yjeF